MHGLAAIPRCKRRWLHEGEDAEGGSGCNRSPNAEFSCAKERWDCSRCRYRLPTFRRAGAEIILCLRASPHCFAERLGLSEAVRGIVGLSRMATRKF
jgi:hypothetical protein